MEQKNSRYGKGIITAFKTLRYLKEETPEVMEKKIIINLYDAKGLRYVKEKF